ncbi:ras-related C3 botulinum toxin substrate 1-like, partial [Achroia grisella]|uniref:ras-related C3 botulinum toxin substrate 1-like n=1 Tax=Achroia grisella TaxID=688607 RepID=UPI0027D20E14
ILKFVLFSCVAKTALIQTFVEQAYSPEPVPTVSDVYYAEVNTYGVPYTLGLLDTSGSEDYDRLRALSYPYTDAFLICFAINNIYSFESVYSKWYPEIRQFSPNTPVILVGTKIDLRDDKKTIEDLNRKKQSPVTYQMGFDMAKSIKAKKYIECSARMQKNVERVFVEAAATATAEKPRKRPSKCVVQ